MDGDQITVKEKVLQQDLYYKNHKIMQYTIKYPVYKSDTYQILASKLNSLYRTKALMYERSNIMNLYQMAMVEYEYSVANNFPIRIFEAFIDFYVTFNQDCAISLYFDQYEYAGGAHGLTVRYSDTWKLQKSKRSDLSELFSDRNKYRENVIQRITQQIQNEMSSGSSTYFEDYKQLVSEKFKANSFYLTKDGIVIYFQQYDIAPYAAGLPTFLIPYTLGGAIPPKCC